MSVENKIIEIISNSLCQPENLVIERKTTLNQLGLDSLDCYELVLDVEDEFDISIVNVHELKTFDDLIKIVEKELELRQ